ncbi:MAG: cupin domain-containing protein [Bacteroidota bacterium]|jgi:cupin 2 domain-containing protein
MIEIKNIFENIPSSFNDEIFESIVQNKNLTIERIISSGQTSPEGEWFNQEKDEWVILLQGSAELKFEDISYTLKSGDYVLIPAHKLHRVERTDENTQTIWLAVHF